MLQSSMRSAALLVLAAGMAATSATAKPPGAPPAAHPAPAPHPAAPPRAAPAPHVAPAAGAPAPHIAAPRVAPQAPRAAPPRVTAAPRTAPPAHRAAPQQVARPSVAPAPAAGTAETGAGHGPKERTVVAPAVEKRTRRSRQTPVSPSPRRASVRDVSLRRPRNAPTFRPHSRRRRPLAARRAKRRTAQPGQALAPAKT